MGVVVGVERVLRDESLLFRLQNVGWTEAHVTVVLLPVSLSGDQAVYR